MKAVCLVGLKAAQMVEWSVAHWAVLMAVLKAVSWAGYLVV